MGLTFKPSGECQVGKGCLIRNQPENETGEVRINEMKIKKGTVAICRRLLRPISVATGKSDPIERLYCSLEKPSTIFPELSCGNGEHKPMLTAHLLK